MIVLAVGVSVMFTIIANLAWHLASALRDVETQRKRADAATAYLREERLLHADCPRCGPAYARMVADRAARGT